MDASHIPNDDALLAAYAAGDAHAARALTQRLGPKVYRHAYRMLGGDQAEAEDVTQDVMLKLWRAAPGWRYGEAKITTWLYRVTANLCIDRLRKTRGCDVEDVPEVVDERPSVPAQLQADTRRAALQSALNTLPERQRQAVVLRHIEGLSNPEIAQIMDIGPRAVESLTARGKRALEALLTGRRDALGYQDDV